MRGNWGMQRRRFSIQCAKYLEEKLLIRYIERPLHVRRWRFLAGRKTFHSSVYNRALEPRTHITNLRAFESSYKMHIYTLYVYVYNAGAHCRDACILGGPDSSREHHSRSHSWSFSHSWDLGRCISLSIYIAIYSNAELSACSRKNSRERKYMKECLSI